MSSTIKVNQLSFGYNSHSVLQDVDLEIRPGELVYFVGGNGSGKSTLIKLILGLLDQDKGQVLIDDKPRTQSIVSKYFGYVPQYADIDRGFPITVREAIRLECQVAQNCSIGVEGHLERFRAEKLMDKKLSELSGGQFQKVMIARALVTDPQILILDEPTNNLDTQAHEYLHQIGAELLKQGKTLIIVTHDVHELEHAETNPRVFEFLDGRVNELS